MIDTSKTRDTIQMLKSATSAKGLASHLCDEIDRLQAILDALTCAEIVRASLALQRHEKYCKQCETESCGQARDLYAEWVRACRAWGKV